MTKKISESNISWHTKPRRENEDAIYKQKYAYFTHKHTTEACNALGSSFLLGAENEGRRPEEIFKFTVSEMPFPGLWGSFDRIVIVRKQRLLVKPGTPEQRNTEHRNSIIPEHRNTKNS